MSWLVVTPARNESARLPDAARALAAAGREVVGLWVVVDDGSTDGTAGAIPAGLPFPVEVLRRDNDGGLSAGSAYGAFLAGAEVGLRHLPQAVRVMKLDADIRLAPDYFDTLVAEAADVDLVTGHVVERDESRTGYTRGPLKAYGRAAFEIVRTMPVALGWDVMDEVALRRAGLSVATVPAALAHATRETGSSEGVLAGRRRAGVVSRWTGYHPVYFALRLLRFATRRPYVVGAAVMLRAWLTAGPGPYSRELRRAKRREQVTAMRAALRPSRTARASAGRSAASRTASGPAAPVDEAGAAPLVAARR